MTQYSGRGPARGLSPVPELSCLEARGDLIRQGSERGGAPAWRRLLGPMPLAIAAVGAVTMAALVWQSRRLSRLEARMESMESLLVRLVEIRH